MHVVAFGGQTVGQVGADEAGAARHQDGTGGGHRKQLQATRGGEHAIHLCHAAFQQAAQEFRLAGLVDHTVMRVAGIGRSGVGLVEQTGPIYPFGRRGDGVEKGLRLVCSIMAPGGITGSGDP